MKWPNRGLTQKEVIGQESRSRASKKVAGSNLSASKIFSITFFVKILLTTLLIFELAIIMSEMPNIILNPVIHEATVPLINKQKEPVVGPNI